MTYFRPRSIVVNGRRTTMRLEESYWTELRRLAAESGTPVGELIAAAAAGNSGNLASAVRVFLLMRLRVSLDSAIARAAAHDTAAPNGAAAHKSPLG